MPIRDRPGRCVCKHSPTKRWERPSRFQNRKALRSTLRGHVSFEKRPQGWKPNTAAEGARPTRRHYGLRPIAAVGEIRRRFRRIRSPGLSFSFLRTFSFFRPKERETAVGAEADGSGKPGRRNGGAAAFPFAGHRSPQRTAFGAFLASVFCFLFSEKSVPKDAFFMHATPAYTARDRSRGTARGSCGKPKRDR